MHARDLVQLATIVTAHAPLWIENSSQLSTVHLDRYWSGSKCRHDRWVRQLKQFVAASTGDAPQRGASLESIRGVLEEILTSEVLTRVWAAVLSAHDRRHRTRDAEPIGRSVFIGHLEARHRALRLLVS